MSLHYFTVFNPSLGPTEETLPNQLLFYTSAATSNLDSQLRNIGLVQGIIELGKSFSPTAPVDFIKSKDTRSYIQELETGYWCVLCLNIISEDGDKDLPTPPVNQILSELRNANYQFKLELCSFEDVLQEGRDLGLKRIEAFWLKWSWGFRADGSDISRYFEGVPESPQPLQKTQKNEVEIVTRRLRDLWDIESLNMMIVIDEEYVYTSSLFSRETQRDLLHFATDPTNTPSVRSEASTRGECEQRELAPGAEAVQESWLSGKKWTHETTRMMAAIRSISTSKPASNATNATTEPAWLYRESGRALYARNPVSHSSLSLRILKVGYITFLLLSDPAESATLEPETVDKTEVALTNLAKEICPSIHFSTTNYKRPDRRVPYFYSLVYDPSTGRQWSTLPSLRHAQSSLDPTRDDRSTGNSATTTGEATIAQRRVWMNTVHLHRHLYGLLRDETNSPLSQLPASHSKRPEEARSADIEGEIITSTAGLDLDRNQDRTQDQEGQHNRQEQSKQKQKGETAKDSDHAAPPAHTSMPTTTTTEHLVKSSRNVWIMTHLDAQGTVLLARSSGSGGRGPPSTSSARDGKTSNAHPSTIQSTTTTGPSRTGSVSGAEETMEDISREARQWIQKLRHGYLETAAGSGTDADADASVDADGIAGVDVTPGVS